MKHIEVVASIIDFNGKMLCVQRNISKFEYISNKYEFPGGKVEKGETKEAALIREIQEELGMVIYDLSHFLTVEHTYPDFKITMHTYKCKVDIPDLKLSEHVDFKWLSANEMTGLDWAAADIPIVKRLKKEENE